MRFCDAKAMQLVKALPADGRWRVVIFAGDIRDHCAAKRLRDVGFVQPFHKYGDTDKN